MALIHGKKIKIFSLNSNRELAQEVADYIGVELSSCEVNRFADGEVQINIDGKITETNNKITQSSDYMREYVDGVKQDLLNKINLLSDDTIRMRDNFNQNIADLTKRVTYLETRVTNLESKI